MKARVLLVGGVHIGNVDTTASRPNIGETIVLQHTDERGVDRPRHFKVHDVVHRWETSSPSVDLIVDFA